MDLTLFIVKEKMEMYIPSGYPTLGTSARSNKMETLKVNPVHNLRNTTRDLPSQQNLREMHTSKKVQTNLTMMPPLTNQHLVMQMLRQNLQSTPTNSKKCLEKYEKTNKKIKHQLNLLA